MTSISENLEFLFYLFIYFIIIIFSWTTLNAVNKFRNLITV